MADGRELIAALVANQQLMRVNECTGAAAQMCRAIYGVTKDDGTGQTLTAENFDAEIMKVFAFGGSHEQVELWHFLIQPSTHHFLIVPWKDTVNPRTVYTVFMAWAGHYDIEDYVAGADRAPNTAEDQGQGYREIWTMTEVRTMLRSILDSKVACSEYFGNVDCEQVATIEYHKLGLTKIDDAVANVGKYERIW